MNAIILSALFGVLMMFASFLINNKKSFRHIASFLMLILLVANIADAYGYTLFSIPTYGMVEFGKYGLLFNSLAIGCTLIYIFISGKEFEKSNYTAEFFVLIFFITCGIALLTSFSNLLMLFLGIEIVSIPLYILTGSDKKNMRSNEAALKYLLMGSFSTGILLMGIALCYGGTGTFALEVVKPVADASPFSKNLASFLEILGLILLVAGMGFKSSAAPFHFWAPDVYDGAPSVVTSYMATIVKAATFIAFLKLCAVRMIDTGEFVNWKMIFSIMVVATLVVGNITAIFQQSVKRMLAYSSVAQAGFMLYALISLNDVAEEGLLLYSVAYSLATIGLFATLIKMKDYTLGGYNGLSKTQPVLAATNAIFLFSLAGIPLTAGFFAKYYMLASVLKTGTYTWIVIVGVIFATVSVFYYFRVIQAMYFKEGDSETSEVSKSFKGGIIALAALVILLGIFPSWILSWLYF